MTDTSRQKEVAAHEERCWVRLTNACNNRCRFCLDSMVQDGRHVPRDEIERQIIAGREERNAARLILSGGEASIHPDFLKFVRMGRRLGYTWIQTITNGRRFSYQKFADTAVGLGLNEATFSMHGHTAELHDYLTGVEGAFEQAIQGMDNLLAHPGFVVNVDVVLTALNYKHLESIMRFFIAKGIHEFDILHLVPFGRGWDDNREELFYDLDDAMPSLEEAFALRQEHDLYVWTNRLPARFLEGNEDLIQDPHKIFDEVRGRQDMLDRFLREGAAPFCRDERCTYCNMYQFCEAASRYRIGMEQGGFRRVHLDVPRWPPALLGVGREIVVPLPHEDPAAVLATLPTDRPLWVVAKDKAELDTCRRIEGLAGCIYEGPLADLDDEHLDGTLPLELPLTRAVAEELSSRALPTASALHTRMVPRERWSEVVDLDPDVETVRALAAKGIPIYDLPRCLGGEGSFPADDIRASTLTDDGTIELMAFTSEVLRGHLFVKSLRCKACAFNDECRGLHINHARAWGLRVLEPQSR